MDAAHMSLQTSRNEFLFLFPNCTGSRLYTNPLILKGNLWTCKIHSAIWKYYLVLAPASPDGFLRSHDWINILRSKRAQFYQLKNDHIHAPPTDDDAADPLAIMDKSSRKWQQYFQDEDLRTHIERDVTRTFQELTYFQLPETQKILSDLLFLFCRTHPHFGYPQGLHELCGFILYTFHQEMVADGTDTLSFIFSANAVIPDTYHTFAALAENLEILYKATTGDESPVVTLAQGIQSRDLAAQSPDLTAALDRSGVAPQSYMVPWLRLLFLRSFNLNDVPGLWDMFVTQLPDLGLIRNLCVAMLLGVSDTIATGDSTEICQCLFHFPTAKATIHYARKAVEICQAAAPRPKVDLQQWVALRLNELARGLEAVCHEKGVEEAAPYIMDLRRTRDLLYGLLEVEEMLPLEQAVELFRPASVDADEVVEPEKPPEAEIVMPKAAAVVSGGGKKSFGDLFEEAVTGPKKKKGKGAKRPPLKDLFD
jgi:hypothetical protein